MVYQKLITEKATTTKAALDKVSQKTVDNKAAIKRPLSKYCALKSDCPVIAAGENHTSTSTEQAIEAKPSSRIPMRLVRRLDC